MATASTTEFGKLSLKTMVTNYIHAGINGDGATAGDLEIKANSGDKDDFQTTTATFHYHVSVPTFSFSANTQIKGLLNPSDVQDAATKSYVDSHKARQLITMSGNNIVIKNVNGAEVWTPANLLSGFIIRTTTSDATDSLPTAQEMIAAISLPAVGSSFNITVHKTGTHAVSFQSNTAGSAAGLFIIGGDSSNSAETDIAPVLNNLRSTTLKILVLNITPGELLCELIMLSDR